MHVTRTYVSKPERTSFLRSSLVRPEPPILQLLFCGRETIPICKVPFFPRPLLLQTSRVQSMYHHFVTSGGAKQFPNSAWILEATYACATGGVPQMPTGAGEEAAAQQLLAPEAALEAAALPPPAAAVAAADPQQSPPPGAAAGIGTASAGSGTALPDASAGGAVGLEPEGSLSPRDTPEAADLWAEAAELARSEVALAEVVRPGAGPTQAGWAAGGEAAPAALCSSGEGLGGIGEAAAGAAVAGAAGLGSGQAGGRSEGRHLDLGEAKLPAGWQAAGSLEEAIKVGHPGFAP